MADPKGAKPRGSAALFSALAAHQRQAGDRGGSAGGRTPSKQPSPADQLVRGAAPRAQGGREVSNTRPCAQPKHKRYYEITKRLETALTAATDPAKVRRAGDGSPRA
jgi:hypothetical protein